MITAIRTLAAAMAATALLVPPAPAIVYTEQREACTRRDPDGQPFFGDLHVHTSFSFDAVVFEIQNDPSDAYAFARGGDLTLPESADDPIQSRTVRLGRPLDFAAVTDHAEFLGPVRVCQTPSAAGYAANECQALRGELAVPPRTMGLVMAILGWTAQTMNAPVPALPGLCSTPGTDCSAAAASAWAEIQHAAETHYDRTAACAFTTFVGYEYSSTPDGNNLHRNVLFRNTHVQDRPTTTVDTAHDVTKLWAALQHECLDAGTGCDVLTIPHNSNVSSGLMFEDPGSPAEAATRAAFEPLVEVYQHKGGSECRFDLRFGTGVGTTDEECAFEQFSRMNLRADSPNALPPDSFPRRAFVRNALADGLALERTLGTNPFQFGLVASTDGHGGTAGMTREDQYEGHLGALDSTSFQAPVNRVSLPLGSNSPGGLAVVWAEENSRDALFAAMRRRETYGTSGTRPVVRFFAGDLPPDLCRRADFVDAGYRRGVPMGGELGDVRGGRSPRLAVWALQDPGEPGRAGNALARIEIVKAWLDRRGTPHESVTAIAGADEGASELCAVHEDRDFDSTTPALYYARVLEVPSPRWSTVQCEANGVNPFADQATCLAQASAAGMGQSIFAEVCCLNETTDPPVQRIIRERAWTSPVWYRPAAIGRLAGTIRFGGGDGDRLGLDARIRALPATVDPGTQALSLELRNDATFVRVALPAGALRRRAGVGKTVFSLRPGAVATVRRLRVDVGRKGRTRIRLAAAGLDLAAVSQADQAIEVVLSAGEFTARHRRRWTRAGDHLATR